MWFGLRIQPNTKKNRPISDTDDAEDSGTGARDDCAARMIGP